MNLGPHRLDVVNDGFFRLDGGAMFGIVPKVLWERAVPADDRNRIRLALNTLLIRTGRRTLLVDTGLGTKLPPPIVEMYGVEHPPSLEEGLRALGVSAGDVDGVVLSHLHFDHAGGATVRGAGGSVVPAFPKATYFIQEGMWAEAVDPNPRTRGSFQPEDFLPLERARQVKLLRGDAEIEPGVTVRVTGGHTRHHQAVFVDGGGRKAVFWADLLPTTAHLRPAWTMGYDLYPAESAALKARWLEEGAREGWIHIFDHDPAVPMARLRADGKGGFRAEPLGAGDPP